MKKKYALAAAMPLVLAFGILGCASSPETKEAEEPPIVESQPIVETEPAEERPVGPSQAANDEAARRASDIQGQIQDARRDAESAGAREHYPDQFGQADSSARRSQELLGAGEASASLAEGQKALSWFQLLKNLAEARNLRETILEYGFDVEDPQSFADAEAKHGEALACFDSNPEQANELSRQALEGYLAVCNSGFMRIAEEEKGRALEARKLCDSIMAARSMAGDYQAATRAFNNAEQSGMQGAWEDACKGYRDSAAMFSDVYQSALYKKNVADEAMRAARARQKASSALALEADRIAPLPDEDEPPPPPPQPVPPPPPEGEMQDSTSTTRIGANAASFGGAKLSIQY